MYLDLKSLALSTLLGIIINVLHDYFKKLGLYDEINEYIIKIQNVCDWIAIISLLSSLPLGIMSAVFEYYYPREDATSYCFEGVNCVQVPAQECSDIVFMYFQEVAITPSGLPFIAMIIFSFSASMSSITNPSNRENDETILGRILVKIVLMSAGCYFILMLIFHIEQYNCI